MGETQEGLNALPRSCSPRTQKPRDASWRRPPPSTAVSSLVKGGIKRRQRGKVIFFSCLSILLVGFFHFLLCTFIKLIIILARAPQVRMNGVFVAFSLQPSPVSGKKEVILTFGLPFYRCSEKARCVSSLKKAFQQLNFTNIFSESPLSISEQNMR